MPDCPGKSSYGCHRCRAASATAAVIVFLVYVTRRRNEYAYLSGHVECGWALSLTPRTLRRRVAVSTRSAAGMVRLAWECLGSAMGSCDRSPMATRGVCAVGSSLAASMCPSFPPPSPLLSPASLPPGVWLACALSAETTVVCSREGLGLAGLPLPPFPLPSPSALFPSSPLWVLPFAPGAVWTV